MSEPKHTPDFTNLPTPWRYNEEGDQILDDNGNMVADVYEWDTRIGSLIAAAPELLEALAGLADQAGSLLSELEYQQVSCPLCGEDPGEGKDALCGVVKALGEASSKARAALAVEGEVKRCTCPPCALCDLGNDHMPCECFEPRCPRCMSGEGEDEARERAEKARQP